MENTKLYYLNIKHIDKTLLEGRINELPKMRREKCLSYRNDIDKIRCIASFLLLKKAFELNDIPFPNADFEVGEYGKPSFKNSINFSISHSGDIVLVALSNKAIGVDIQKIVECKPSIVSKCFDDYEQSILDQAQNKDETFTSIWAKKESLIKETGDGITVNLKNVDSSKAVSLIKEEYVFASSNEFANLIEVKDI